MDIHAYLKSIPPHVPLLRFLFSFDAPKIILDIGACEGEDSIRYKRLFPQARIIAFEPNTSNVEKLSRNLKYFECDDIEIMPYALSSSDGTASMHISSGRPEGLPKTTDWDWGNKSSSLLKPSALMTKFHSWLRFDTEVRVPTRRLDSVLTELGIKRVDFIHMDVQGAELMVLQGSVDILPSVACIWLEVGTEAIYEHQPSAAKTQKFLEGIGFIRLMEVLTEGSGDHFYINPQCLRVVKIA
jgi:FkbM family methyltransferase